MVSLSSITSRITPIINNIKSTSPLGLAVKAAGVAGVGIALYDANHKGVRTAKEDKEYTQSNIARDSFRRTRYNTNDSHFTSGVKDKLFKWSLGNKVAGAAAATIGYVKGFVGNAINHVVPLALSAGAILGKGKIAQGSAIGLLAYGVYSAFSGCGKH